MRQAKSSTTPNSSTSNGPRPGSAHDIAIVGRSCRLPGAPSIAAFWRLLVDARCAVTTIPASRWALAQDLHPRVPERGRTYTWAAGVLDDIWSFDPGAFGISPREAVQMDPQQRLLLELTWEALEDAGIRPSRLGGGEAGVFIGASAVDHANLRMLDMAAADAYMMTGNTLSILANRVSHVFDLHGPSFTIDTACSSSLVALNEAVASLRSGRIDTAIVGGVSILASPQSFVGFSQAAMLSRRGLCQAFSADADGYVRAEGGVVLVLQTQAAAVRDGNSIHALIAACDINSDGRTNGISLPSKRFQAELLARVYRDIDPNALAFVETHGTGTPVGDPIEAEALGETLGRSRRAPLPIGSVKTNIGHMEAASGLGGLLKAMLALEHDLLPPSLHSASLNPAIDFDGLNLAVAREAVPLARPDGTRRLAGINSFGFGGANAHVTLTDAAAAAMPCVAVPPAYLVISAQSRAALGDLVAAYAARLGEADETEATALLAATARRRDRLTERLVMPVGRRTDMVGALESLRDGGDDVAAAARGHAIQRGAPVAFVFSGNGSQFAGMGRVAYARSRVFRARLDAISETFAALAGWSIIDALHAEDLVTTIARTQIAQPLLFAIQSAACHALRYHGLEPDVVIGHSVGEVAAAEAADSLDDAAALRVIYARSLHQELAYGRGRMAVVIGPREATLAILADLPGLEIAAYNSPRAVTLSGTGDDIARLADVARCHKVRVRKLDIAYPFHSSGMASVRCPLLRDLAGLAPSASRVPFLSTVTGAVLDGRTLDADYWWRNVREPVRFSDAIAAAVHRGVRIFLEIGPAATLLSHVSDTVDERISEIATIAALDRRDRGVDPLMMTVATAIARGADVDEAKAYGSGPNAGVKVRLPPYPWQRSTFRLPETSEAVGVHQSARSHPLIGARIGLDELQWRSCLDSMRVPSLSDHCIDGHTIMPGAAYAEMMLAVARDWLETDDASISDIEITSPMPLSVDAAREVTCRLAAGTSQVEIASRPRFSAGPWQLHATGKIVRDTTIGVLPDRGSAGPVEEAVWIGGADIYAMAARVGLQFGPLYRGLARAALVRPDYIRFDLTQDDVDPAFGLDPARLDSCFHALLLVFANRRETGVNRAYVPVRFGSVHLRKPGAQTAAGLIDVRRCDARAIIADVLITDATGDVVALVRDARFQPMRTSAPAALVPIIRPNLVLASEPTAARRNPALSLEILRRGIVAADPAAPMDDDYVLLEGWATSLALRMARDLATAHVVDVDALVATARLPAQTRRWFESVLSALERSGLCHSADGCIHVAADIVLPAPDAILRTIAHEHHALSTELLVASSALIAVNALVGGAAPGPLARRIVDDFETGSRHAQSAARALRDVLRASAGAWPKDRAIRILQVGSGPFTPHAVALAMDMQARLTIFEPEPRGRETLGAIFPDFSDLEVLERLDGCKVSSFDLVIASATLTRRLRLPGFWATLRRIMAPDAIFAAIEPPSSLFRDFVLGLDTCLGDDPLRSIVPCPGIADWQGAMRAAGLKNTQADFVVTDAGTALLLTAQVEAGRRHWRGTGAVLIVGDDSCRTHTTFATLLASAGVHVSIVCDVASVQQGELPQKIVLFAPEPDASEPAACRVLDQCMRLKRIVDSLDTRQAQLWLVTTGATRGQEHPEADVAAALCAFSRTIANEVPSLDIRRIDIATDLRPDDVADRLRDLLLSDTDETEIHIGRAATHVTRFAAGARNTANSRAAEAARLSRLEGAGIDRISWRPIRRRAPDPDEVEIVVEAIGLNFRDVMLSLGLLPEVIVEDGFAGLNLGLECAGHIARVGSGVKGLKRGDNVMAFARNAFATHVTTSAGVVVLLPEGVSIDAAASIPVAFLTAYYALVTCARLKRGEWILIHGGAGGVGLAALQIARLRGARVIATAGAPEKRALLETLGADYVFDSRAGSFVDDVRQAADKGVAVVLNSLSGEAMERSIGLLRPFGRFVELGKRDYAANTHIGLRPFRRNLTYFGVDLDQLLVEAPATSKRLMGILARLFARGDLTPLPYRMFEARETTDAFHLMRQAGHVGKLVVRPPRRPPALAARPQRPFKAAADKTHVITGGFGGFGLETACWLASCGARTILLLGRNGPATDTARTVLADLAAQGIHVETEALDVADKSGLQRIFARFGRDLPPLAGVVHAAMVLDDALVANLTHESMERVLRPKVSGADNLDQLTRGIPLDYFILYSSATVLLGNPGQGAYVAANAYLEGLARRRRRAGLPALAVAWGAIDDVGVLARAEATRDLLAAHAGVKGMRAQEALSHLGDVLSSPLGVPQEATIAIASIDWSQARAHLAILDSPAYGRLTSSHAAATCNSDQIDIAALVAKTNPDAARTVVGNVIVDEVSRVLRLPREDVARTVSLSEIGLDSLMAVELALGLGGRFTLHAPVSTQASTFTVNELADHLIDMTTGQLSQGDTFARSMVDRHFGIKAEGPAVEMLIKSATSVETAQQTVSALLQ